MLLLVPEVVLRDTYATRHIFTARTTQVCLSRGLWCLVGCRGLYMVTPPPIGTHVPFDTLGSRTLIKTALTARIPPDWLRYDGPAARRPRPVERSH